MKKLIVSILAFLIAMQSEGAVFPKRKAAIHPNKYYKVNQYQVVDSPSGNAYMSPWQHWEGGNVTWWIFD